MGYTVLLLQTLIDPICGWILHSYPIDIHLGQVTWPVKVSCVKSQQEL